MLTAIRGVRFPLLCVLALAACGGSRSDETGNSLKPAGRDGGSSDGGSSDDAAAAVDDAGESVDGALLEDADLLDAELGDAGAGDAQLDTGDADSGAVELDATSDASSADAESAEAGVDGAAPDCDAGVQGSRIQISFHSANAERVTSLRWIDSSGTLAPQLVTEGGSGACGDPTEFFGASYGAAENTSPYPVVAGSRSKLAGCGNDLTITSDATNCAGMAQLPVTTSYHFYTGDQASQLRVTRTFGFDAASPAYTAAALRTYIPRVPRTQYSRVIYPSQDGSSVTTTETLSCPNDCIVSIGTTWNGSWFADIDPTSGRAIIVVRDPSSTGTPRLAINYDSYSSSNLTGFAIARPTGGWQEPQTAIEYLCFADLTSWPAEQRSAAQLPAHCGPE